MKKLILLFLCAVQLAAYGDKPTKAAYDLIERITPGYGKQFRLEIARSHQRDARIILFEKQEFFAQKIFRNERAGNVFATDIVDKPVVARFLASGKSIGKYDFVRLRKRRRESVRKRDCARISVRLKNNRHFSVLLFKCGNAFLYLGGMMRIIGYYRANLVFRHYFAPAFYSGKPLDSLLYVAVT